MPAGQTQELQVVYQSNEIVPATGQYQLVESKPSGRPVKGTGPLENHEPTIQQFSEGDVFPNVEGRSVAWRKLKE